MEEYDHLILEKAKFISCIISLSLFSAAHHLQGQYLAVRPEPSGEVADYGSVKSWGYLNRCMKYLLDNACKKVSSHG